MTHLYLCPSPFQVTLSSETVCQILAPPQILPSLEGSTEGKGYPSAGAVGTALGIGLGQFTSGIESQLHSTFGSKNAGGSGTGTGMLPGVDNSAQGRNNTASATAAAMTKEERMYPRTGGKRLASCFAVTDCLQVTPPPPFMNNTLSYTLQIHSHTPSKYITPLLTYVNPLH